MTNEKESKVPEEMNKKFATKFSGKAVTNLGDLLKEVVKDKKNNSDKK